MNISLYQWFEVTIRYYNPAFPEGATTETIALEAASFTDAVNRTRELYSGLRPCLIQSVNPTLFEDVLYAESFSPVMHWYLVELEEDHQMVAEHYQYLKDEGCNCAFLERCCRSNVDCKSSCCSEIEIFNGDYECDHNCVSSSNDHTSALDNCQRSSYKDYSDYTSYGNIRTVDYLNAPTCFRLAGATAHKAFILVQGPDFTHVLNKVKEYIYDSILDYNILAIEQTHLCQVIPHDRCQL